MPEKQDKRLDLENEQILTAALNVFFEEEARDNAISSIKVMPHAFSLRHKRKMEKILYPQKHKMRSRIAIIIIAVLFAIPALLITTVKAFREETLKWVMGDRALRVDINSETKIDDRFKTPPLQIDGYIVNGPLIFGHTYSVDFVESDTGNAFTLLSTLKEPGFSLGIDNESDYLVVEIMGYNAFFLEKPEENILLFEDELCVYNIIGNFDLKTGIQIANSIK